MWRWQPSGLNARTVLQAKLVIGATALHVVALFCMFVVYRGYNAQLHIDISKALAQANVPVVFLPLHKQLQSAGAGKRAGSAAKGAKQATEKPAVVKPQQKKSPTTIAPVTKEMPAANKKKQNKKAAKKNKKVAKKEKAVVKKELPKPKPEPKKAVPEKPAANVEEKKIVEEVKEVKPAQELKPQPETAQATEQPAPADTAQEALYIGQMEHDALLVQQEILQELEQHWRPPVGLARTVACQIKIIIGWDGNAADIIMEKPSGVLTYDIQARAAVRAMHFPKAAWGKELVLHFNNEDVP